MKQEETKHTQGPWTVRQGDIVYSDHKGRFVADCERTPHHKRPAPPDPEDAANARLIAAAPDLLEALGNAVVLVHHIANHQRITDIDVAQANAALPLIRAAIAKATQA